MTWTNLYSDIAAIFGDLAGDDRRDADVAWRAAHQREKDRERWRQAKRRLRLRLKREGKKQDQRHYAKRYATDAAFRERRKAYWRDYDKKRRNRKRAAKGHS